MAARKQSPIEAAGGKRANVWKIEVEKIRIDPDWNVRIDYGDLEQLARSIASEGVREPLRGYFDENGNAIVTDGHRRLKAIALAKEKFGAEIKRVTFQLEPRNCSAGERVLTMLISNSGKNLAPYEIGLVVKRLRAYGWEIEEIQARAGYTKGYLERCERLAAATPEIRQMMFEDNTVSQTTAMQAIEQHGVDRAAEVMKEAIAQAKSVGKAKATGVLVREVGLKLAEGGELDGDVQTEAGNRDASGKAIANGQLSLVEIPTQSSKRARVEVLPEARDEALCRVREADWPQLDSQELLKVVRLLDRNQIPAT